MTSYNNQISRWNWGAFFLPELWGIRNKAFFPIFTTFFVFIICEIFAIKSTKHTTILELLSVLPYLYLAFIHFLYGFKGNEWAWRNSQWVDLNHFQKIQKYWAFGGLFFWIIVPSAFFYISSLIYYSELFQKTVIAASVNKEIKTLLGEPISSSPFPFMNGNPIMPIQGNMQTTDDTGHAVYSFRIRGTKNRAEVLVSAIMRKKIWYIQKEKAYIPDYSSAQKEIDIIDIDRPSS